MQVQLESFVRNTDSIPLRMDSFRTNISDLSDWMLSATEQPLLIDSIRIVPPSRQVPSADSGFWGRFAFEMQSFVSSFLVDYDVLGGSETTGKKPITLWMGSMMGSTTGTGRDQAQALKSLIDNGFTPKQGYGVNMMLVDLNSLLPAVASGRGPDVTIGLDRTLPMNYAYRGALLDLSGFPDLGTVLQRFNPEAVTPFRNGDSVYALPDTYTFYMMFYRKDVLDELHIQVPQTWDDVFEIIPQLQN